MSQPQPSTEEQVRSIRDSLLMFDFDPVRCNPIRWDALTDEHQTLWLNYRTALLNVPQQSGFPSNVVWPTKPEA